MKLSLCALHVSLAISYSRAFTINPMVRICTQSKYIGDTSMSRSTTSSTSTTTALYAAGEADDIDIDDAEEVAAPGTMRVAEIKSELELRGIIYSDCFDKESLAQKLVRARASGTADPSIIDQFNKQKQQETFEIDDDILNKATSGDGTLPGGMPPDMLKELMGNPELMELMGDPKLQEVMKVMMTGGQEAIEIAMIEDKEVYELVTKLNGIMGKTM